MKTLFLGDIHGRPVWLDIIQKENPDKVVFLGDLVTTHDPEMTVEKQIENLNNIIEYRNEHSDDTIFLIGNHDLQMMGYPWTSGWSGYDPKLKEAFPKNFAEMAQFVYTFHVNGQKWVASHAGISTKWLTEILDFTGTLEHINSLPIDARFGFTGGWWDRSGDDPQQSCTWIRPNTLINNMAHPKQIVGHTPVRELTHFTSGELELFLCDALDLNQYLVLEDNEFKIKTL